MIYVVTSQLQLFNNPNYEIISVEKSLEMISSWDVIQFDSETDGRDCHINKLLCIQLGNDSTDTRIVIDCTTTDILLYKEELENNYLIGHNLKFDLQFLYNYGIVPRKVYDTMIVEQLLYLGYPNVTISKEEYIKYNYDFPYLKSELEDYYTLSMSLKAVAYKYLGIDIDKSTRGEIIWRGLDDKVILYAAGDVTYLEKIADLQYTECTKKYCVVGAKLECDFVPAISYLEWCGIKLDETKWKEKMSKDLDNLNTRKEALDNFVVEGNYSDFYYLDPQGDLFLGFQDKPKCTINWSSSKQVIKFAQKLGFNTTVQDKNTGEDKDSVIEKHLSSQKGINDTFLQLYFDYQESAKVVSSFGQGHLNAINPKTGRIHTSYKQIGTTSGRMSCGSNNSNTDLEKYKKLSKGSCKYPNIQQLPNDEITRACFVSEKDNLFISCDYSAQEGRVQGDIYQDEAILKMYREGIDGHSMYAKIFFKDELKDIDVHDVKKLRPDLRSKAKGPEFALAYGGGYTTIMQSLKCSEEEALQIVKNYEEGFKGTIEFARKGSAFVRKNGYIIINPTTGHKTYWWDYKKWVDIKNSFSNEFWEDYRINHKGTGDSVHEKVSKHFRAAGKYDRLARNSPAQGTSAIMTKVAVTDIFNWIVDNGYFSKILCCALVHDETCWEYPKDIPEFADIVKTYMEKAASEYCKSIEIPAEAAIGLFWIH